MSYKIDGNLQDELRRVLDSEFSDDAMKRVKKAAKNIVQDLEDDLMWRLKDELAGELVGWVAEMAQRAVEQILEGNEDQMRRYLSCEKRGDDGKYICYTGRADSTYFPDRDAPERWHPMIHGELFEQGAIALRRKIVDAHRDVLVSERILDLESQVQSLVSQNVKLIQEREKLRERLSAAA